MNDLPKVSLRGGFSDRNRIKSENNEIQYTDLDQRTRSQILNLCNRLYEVRAKNSKGSEFQQNLIKSFLTNVYCENVGIGVKFYPEWFFKTHFNKTILKDSYDAVLTVVEYFCDIVGGDYGLAPNGEPYQGRVEGNVVYVQDIFNDLFRKEFVGYRFVNRIITPITNEQEIQSIEEAVHSPYDEVNEHLDKALVLLSDRENPDYPNTIKESITAVEAMCALITGVGNKKATLGNMLKVLEDQGYKIHSSLKSAFDKLYGYTCDAKGIRHSGDLDGPDATFDEAKYMLVSCSAFVNYLIGVTSKKV